MRFFAISFSVLFPVLFLLGCIDEYSDSIEIRENGSAAFYASLYPCEPDESILSGMRADYDSIPGLKFDSAWFSQKDTAYSLNFKVSFENLLTWQGNRKVERDFIGSISLKKTGHTYSFERVINPSTESEDGFIVPEETVSSFILEQIHNDSAFWEYAIVLPKKAVLLSSEPVDVAAAASKDPVLRWKIPIADAISKRISFKAEYSLQATTEGSDLAGMLSIAAGLIIMLLAIALLVRKLKKLSTTLKDLKNAERDFKEE